MSKPDFKSLSIPDEEEFYKNFGFSYEDISHIISPQSNISFELSPDSSINDISNKNIFDNENDVDSNLPSTKSNLSISPLRNSNSGKKKTTKNKKKSFTFEEFEIFDFDELGQSILESHSLSKDNTQAPINPEFPVNTEQLHSTSSFSNSNNQLPDASPYQNMMMNHQANQFFYNNQYPNNVLPSLSSVGYSYPAYPPVYNYYMQGNPPFHPNGKFDPNINFNYNMAFEHGHFQDFDSTNFGKKDKLKQEKTKGYQKKNSNNDNQEEKTKKIRAKKEISPQSTEQPDTSRASKSLATISRRFVEHFGEKNTIEYISGHLDIEDTHEVIPVANRVDGAAEILNVHVRRIYELIKILEILSLVTFSADKRGRFSWKGTKEFLITLGKIQADAIMKNPELAISNGLVYDSSDASSSEYSKSESESNKSSSPPPLSPESLSNGECTDAFSSEHFDQKFESNEQSSRSRSVSSSAKRRSFSVITNDLEQSESDAALIRSIEKSLSKSKSFPISNDESENLKVGKKKRTKIAKTPKLSQLNPEGKIASEEHQEHMVDGICKSFLQLFLLGLDSISMNFAIHKLVPIKEDQTITEYNKQNATKIRRIYDVANVLCSLNLIKKISVPKEKVCKSEKENGKDSKNEHKSESKVLEWSSFPPQTIREYYISKMISASKN